jgi:hypothetical protein
MHIEIKNRYTCTIIFAGEYESVKDAVTGAYLAGANLTDADLTDADLIGADLRYADLRYADLRDANLRYANLRGANLRDADLADADLRGANLIGADLADADLRGAIGAPYTIFICGSRHDVWTDGDIIKIGCEVYNVDEWVNQYCEIGRANGYSPDEISEYKAYIDLCSQFVPKKATDSEVA